MEIFNKLKCNLFCNLTKREIHVHFIEDVYCQTRDATIGNLL